jgi:hypothetical protein
VEHFTAQSPSPWNNRKYDKEISPNFSRDYTTYVKREAQLVQSTDLKFNALVESMEAEHLKAQKLAAKEAAKQKKN